MQADVSVLLQIAASLVSVLSTRGLLKELSLNSLDSCKVSFLKLLLSPDVSSVALCPPEGTFVLTASDSAFGTLFRNVFASLMSSAFLSKLYRPVLIAGKRKYVTSENLGKN